MGNRRRAVGVLTGAGVVAVVTASAIMVGGSPGETPGASGGTPGAPVPGRRPVPGPLLVGELVEDPPGPVTLTSYSVVGHMDMDREGPGMTAFVPDPATGRFEQTNFAEARLSPDGRTVAGVQPDPSAGTNRLVLVDRRSGERHAVPVPPRAGLVRWSPRGRQVLLTAHAKPPASAVEGFVIVDADTRRSRFSPVSLRSAPVRFTEGVGAAWGPRGEHVVFVIGSEDGTRMHRVGAGGGDLGEGVPLRGSAAVGEALFSPTGRVFATACDGESTCLWDASGPAPQLIRRLPGLSMPLWCGDDRLFAARRRDEHWETVLVDLEGRDPRVIARDTTWVPGPGLLGAYSPIPR